MSHSQLHGSILHVKRLPASATPVTNRGVALSSRLSVERQLARRVDFARAGFLTATSESRISHKPPCPLCGTVSVRCISPIPVPVRCALVNRSPKPNLTPPTTNASAELLTLECDSREFGVSASLLPWPTEQPILWAKSQGFLVRHVLTRGKVTGNLLLGILTAW